MASHNPPPEWLKEWAKVAAHVSATLLVLFRILRAVGV